ncbi:MAG: PqqD family protein [Oscillospiraceae bacterium]|nr:PqqD family protein [Oscillospiraceae bacterium]
MKFKRKAILSQLGGDTIAVPVEGKFNGMIRLNDTGALIWKGIEEQLDEQQIVSRMMDEYDVDHETALKSVRSFVEKLRENDLLEP